MNFMSSSPEHIEKVTSDNTALGYDLLSNLTYMSVLTIGGLSRDKIMELSSAQALRTSVFFDYVVGLVKTAGFEYGEAFKIVASKARASVISSLFLRFSAALSSGESEKDFIIQEADIAMERYKNDYERSVENLRKWTDAYSAILVSVTLVMVVCLISTIIASMNELFIVLMALSISSVTSIGLYIIFKVAPIETKEIFRNNCVNRFCISPDNRVCLESFSRVVSCIRIPRFSPAAYGYSCYEGGQENQRSGFPVTYFPEKSREYCWGNRFKPDTNSQRH